MRLSIDRDRSRSSKIINWSADSFQINHVTSMSWHMSPRYGHGILVSGYSVLTAVNWPYCECPLAQCKRCGLCKTRLRHSWRKNVLRRLLRTLIAGSRRAFLCVDCVCLLLEFWMKCTRCERLLPVKHFYLKCLLFFVAWKLLWIQNNQC